MSLKNVVEQLPEDISSYITLSLDPYHDVPKRFEGAPTSRSAASVVLKIDQEMTVNAGSFLVPSTSTSWDFHLAMLPNLASMSCSVGNELNYHFQTSSTTATAPSRPMGPITMCGVPVGQATFVYDTTNASLQWITMDNAQLTNYITDSTATNGPGRRVIRIVGCAFEVIDNTPDIYKQGSVTVYRQPQCETTIQRSNRFWNPTLSTPALAYTRQYPVTDLQMPPSNLQSAVLYSGATTWQASKGCYCVGTPYVSEIPFKEVGPVYHCYTGYNPTIGTSLTNGQYSLVPTNYLYAIAGDSIISQSQTVTPDAVFPFNTSGAYFTGLNTQYGSLRVRYRVFAEILPTPSDSTLIPLATPTIPFSSEVSDYLISAFKSMPAGVPQTHNPAGEYWRKLLGTVEKASAAISPMASLVSPELGAIVAGVGAGAKLANAKKKKKQNPPKTNNNNKK